MKGTILNETENEIAEEVLSIGGGKTFKVRENRITSEFRNVITAQNS